MYVAQGKTIQIYQIQNPTDMHYGQQNPTSPANPTTLTITLVQTGQPSNPSANT
jgi:hypothetical protein